MDDGSGRAAGGRPFDKRDGAEGAGGTATIGDLEIGRGSLPGGLRAAVVGSGDRSPQQREETGGVAILSGSQPGHKRADFAPAACAQQGIHTGHLLDKRFPPELWQAAGSDKHLVSAFGVDQFLQPVQRFPAGSFDKTAGIDNEHLGLTRLLDRQMAQALEQTRHALSIHQVFGTAQRLKIKLHLPLLVHRQ